ncbi:hypothetical protein XENORESO_006008 [Xenotaenia resolanae]|uniref:Uncharacterized protein n=1 Tax=Xenotaenia resolanae TaxID=208358 RepID=A0ABV0WP66_9TELE
MKQEGRKAVGRPHQTLRHSLDWLNSVNHPLSFSVSLADLSLLLFKSPRYRLFPQLHLTALSAVPCFIPGDPCAIASSDSSSFLPKSGSMYLFARCIFESFISLLT